MINFKSTIFSRGRSRILSLSFIFLALAFSFSVFLLTSQKASASSISNRLSGKILLQVEANGEAHYVNPLDKKRYYLGRPHDAFNIMRSLGLGVSNSDLLNFLKNGARPNLSGRILLQVEDKGQAYYVFPDNLKLYYLGRPHDAFNIMRQLGLGITNSDLNQVQIGYLSGQTPTIPDNGPGSLQPGPGEKLVNFTWRYKNKNYSLEQIFSDSLYNEYKNSQKQLTYPSNSPPANLREAYYDIFLNLKSGDNSVDNILSKLRSVANSEGFTDDEYIEFVMAFVQFIPYDFSKNENSPQNFSYETLYTNSGVCSDKAFLALIILRKLGYGGAIFDYPSAKHSAVAIACSGQSSYNSGYCFIETTNYFPVGVFPTSLNSGQAKAVEPDWANIFKGDSLGSLEIYQKTTGKVFGGMSKVVNMVNSISKMRTSILQKNTELATISNQLAVMKAEIDQLVDLMAYYSGQNDTANYNATVSQYNIKADEYNSILNGYRLKLEIYNNDVRIFNKTVSDFFQN